MSSVRTVSCITWLGLALALPACNAEPDVVATNASPAATDVDGAARFPDLPVVNRCEAGTYVGYFTTLPLSVMGEAFLEGKVHFSLGEDRGEFVVIDTDSRLEGSSGTATFSADVRGDGPCLDGAIKTVLANGCFYPQGPPDSGGPCPVPFEGRVEGTYRAEPPPGAFAGSWEVQVGGSAVGTLTGVWSAVNAGR